VATIDRLHSGRFDREVPAPITGGIELSERIQSDVAIVFLHACKLGCEDIVSKRRDAPYRSGRVRTWIKIKNPASPPGCGNFAT
jgi:ATP-dependent DNA ligase